MERHSGLCLTAKTCALLMRKPHKSKLIEVAIFLPNVSWHEVYECALCDTPQWVWNTGGISDCHWVIVQAHISYAIKGMVWIWLFIHAQLSRLEAWKSWPNFSFSFWTINRIIDRKRGQGNADADLEQTCVVVSFPYRLKIFKTGIFCYPCCSRVTPFLLRIKVSNRITVSIFCLLHFCDGRKK